MLDDIDIAVVGAGLMGHGIAQVFALEGARVTLHDPSPEVLESAPARVADNLRALGQDEASAGAIALHSELEPAVAAADWVFEAAPEDLELKRELFARLDALAPSVAVLASNSSVMPIGEIAARMERPERAVGTHWWNPPYLVPLVEVIQGAQTGADVVERTMELLTRAGKTPVHVKRDVPGFIGNRLQHALWRQAFELVERGVCDAEAVDTVVKAAFGPRLAVLGPMENADLVGLDLTLQIHDYVLPTLDPPSGAAAGLKERVAAGRLGMKTGSGFRSWTPEAAADVRRRLMQHLAGAWPATSQRGGGER
jgi:3-hydroxybutyryl-CoA dehydrogenase